MNGSVDILKHQLEVRARDLINEIAKTDRKDIAVALLVSEMDSWSSAIDRQESIVANQAEELQQCHSEIAEYQSQIKDLYECRYEADKTVCLIEMYAEKILSK